MTDNLEEGGTIATIRIRWLAGAARKGRRALRSSLKTLLANMPVTRSETRHLVSCFFPTGAAPLKLFRLLNLVEQHLVKPLCIRANRI